MRLRFSLICLILLALAAFVPLTAVAQSSAYTAIVPVPDTSGPQRDHAFTVGLAQVLGREAGRDLSAQPGYADALAKAPSLVQQYQYQRADSGGGFLLQITFDRPAVRHLINSFGAATWSGSRPPVLLLVHDASGRMLGADQLVALTQAAGARGVNFVFPARGDVLDADKLAGDDEHALADVARRYHTGLILIGRVSPAGADWTLVSAGTSQQWQSSGPDRGSMLASAGDTLVDRLTTQFGSAPEGVGGTGTLWVGGITSAGDFAQLLSLVRENNLVSKVVPEQAQGDGALLRVTARVPVAAMADELVAEGHLMPASAHAGADASVRWLH